MFQESHHSKYVGNLSRINYRKLSKGASILGIAWRKVILCMQLPHPDLDPLPKRLSTEVLNLTIGKPKDPRDLRSQSMTRVGEQVSAKVSVPLSTETMTLTIGSPDGLR